MNKLRQYYDDKIHDVEGKHIQHIPSTSEGILLFFRSLIWVFNSNIVLICCDRSGLISLISLHSNNAFIKLVGQQSVEDCRQFLFSVK